MRAGKWILDMTCGKYHLDFILLRIVSEHTAEYRRSWRLGHCFSERCFKEAAWKMRYHCECGIVLQDEYEAFRHAARTGHGNIQKYVWGDRLQFIGARLRVLVNVDTVSYSLFPLEPLQFFGCSLFYVGCVELLICPLWLLLNDWSLNHVRGPLRVKERKSMPYKIPNRNQRYNRVRRLLHKYETLGNKFYRSS